MLLAYGVVVVAGALMMVMKQTMMETGRATRKNATPGLQPLAPPAQDAAPVHVYVAL